MNDLLFPSSMLAAFIIASFVLAVTPGPGVFYIVTRSLVQGRRSGLASVAGVSVGNLVNAIGASVGLAVVFAVSAVAFAIVKYGGAMYLIYLGIRALRATRSDLRLENHKPARPWRIFADGFIVALLNPKTALFFAAFLPQFMGTEATSLVQGIVLGMLFVAIAAITDGVYALAAGTLAPLLRRTQGVEVFSRYFTGGVFIGLGVFTAVTGSQSAK